MSAPLYFLNIRLLTESADGQGLVYVTFRGAFLVGVAAVFNGLWRPVGEATKEKEGWDKKASWILCQAESGKLVVYYLPPDGQKGVGKVTVFADWRALVDHAPPDIIVEAKRKAGVLGETIPEIPLSEAE
jgi:hypothetical protein